MKFKVGDKVRRKKRDQCDHYKFANDAILTVSWSSNEKGRDICLEEIPNEWWASEYFELVTENEANEAYLQSLVNKANEGASAEYELRVLAVERLQHRRYNSTGGWTQAYRVTDPNVYEFQLTPPKPRERKFRLQDWNCVITKDTVKVGCQEFPKATCLQQALDNIIRHNCTFDAWGKIRLEASKKGISYEGHVLTWENADKLLAELEAFEQENK